MGIHWFADPESLLSRSLSPSFSFGSRGYPGPRLCHACQFPRGHPINLASVRQALWPPTMGDQHVRVQHVWHRCIKSRLILSNPMGSRTLRADKGKEYVLIGIDLAPDIQGHGEKGLNVWGHNSPLEPLQQVLLHAAWLSLTAASLYSTQIYSTRDTRHNITQPLQPCCFLSVLWSEVIWCIGSVWLRKWTTYTGQNLIEKCYHPIPLKLTKIKCNGEAMMLQPQDSRR